MRITITRPDWDRGYYHSAQREGQTKIVDEPTSVEVGKVATVLADLAEAGFISTTTYDHAAFERFRALVKENFFVFWTAINPPMERLLYALSAILRPRNVIGIGIFTGNPLVWSFGPALDGTYAATKLVGVEIEPNNARLCQDNFDQIRGKVPVTIRPADGLEVLEEYADGELDLLYLDAAGYEKPDPATGEKVPGKNINYLLIKKAYAKLRPGGVVLCHNAYQPSFQRDACAYLDFVARDDLFAKTATIGIDEMGLEFSLKY